MSKPKGSNGANEEILGIQAMQFSPFNKPFKEEIDVMAWENCTFSGPHLCTFQEWAEKLLYVSECLDGWLKVQRVSLVCIGFAWTWKRFTNTVLY